MSTAAIDFSQYASQAPPQAIDFSKYEKGGATETPSAASRLGSNFLSGLGVTSDEQAKSFFKHPLDTVIKSFQSQGELAKKAKEAYDRGDYMEALQHSLNYMVPFVGQQTDQAGTQLKEGDIAGGIGRTLGAAVPIVAGSPEVQATTSDVLASAAAKTSQAVKTTAAVVKDVATPENIATAVGGAAGAKLGAVVGEPFGGGAAGAAVGRAIGKSVAKKLAPKVPEPVPVTPEPATPEPAPVYPGAPQPTATLEQLNPSLVSPARTLPGQISPEVIRPPFQPAAPIPPRTGLALPPGPEEAAAAPAPRTLSDLSGLNNRTLSGEGAVSEVLSRLPNKTQLQIARSRGVNVSAEAALKPTAGVTNRIIGKIVDSFSPEELQDFRASYLENEGRFDRHQFGDIGKEANQVLNLKTYFPELKIPAASEIRTARAIADAQSKASAPQFSTAGTDVASQIEKAAPAPRTLADLSATGKAPAPSDDLTSLLSQSLKQAQEQGVKTTASPSTLAKRWGVDEESLAIGREQTRGMSPVETESDVQDLVDRYKKGEAVEPVIETRDSQNNIISVDGRARALAARRAGVKRIPIIVRRPPTDVIE